jgi:hypothetical protein
VFYEFSEMGFFIVPVSDPVVLIIEPVGFIIGFTMAGAAEIDLGTVVGKLDNHDVFF